MPMKYIILDTPHGQQPVVFPASFNHSWMAGQMKDMEVVSAGFVDQGPDGVSCHGFSESLGVKSRPDFDTELLARLLVPVDRET